MKLINLPCLVILLYFAVLGTPFSEYKVIDKKSNSTTVILQLQYVGS